MYIVGRQTLSENHLTVVNLLPFFNVLPLNTDIFRRKSDKVETDTSAAL